MANAMNSDLSTKNLAIRTETGPKLAVMRNSTIMSHDEPSLASQLAPSRIIPTNVIYTRILNITVDEERCRV